MLALQEINPLRALFYRRGVTGLLTYLKTNIYDTSYYDGSFGRIRHQSRLGGFAPGFRRHAPFFLRRGEEPKNNFSHLTLCAYPPARVMRIRPERGHTGEPYPGSLPAYRHRVYRHRAGYIEPLRRYVPRKQPALDGCDRRAG